jgi:hypothetical protein
MISNYDRNKKYTIAEHFFVQKSLELVFIKTIDSYRVRLNNPYTILKELVQVLSDWNQKKIKNFETVNYVIKEANNLISQCSILKFNKVSKAYYIELLTSSSADKNSDLYYSTKILVEENKGYLKNLFDSIHNEIIRLNQIDKFEIHELNDLNKLTGYLISDLLNFGYSKGYVNQIFFTLFTKKNNSVFLDSFTICRELFGRPSESFRVIFKIKVPEDLKGKLNLDHLLIPQEEMPEIVALNEESKSFIETKTNNFNKHIKIEVNAKDYFVAIKKAKLQISQILDLVFLGFNHPGLKIYTQVLVIGERNSEKAKTNPIFYKIDGSYKVGQDLYESFIEKFSIVSSNQKVAVESNQKIKSAIRYLRLGSEANEIEQKFINFWIGLEYIFSSYYSEQSTFNRIKQNLVTVHSLVYLKRNMIEFHEDLKRLKKLTKIPGSDGNLIYLKEVETYNFIKSSFCQLDPLLAYRAYELKKDLFTSNERLKAILKRHQLNLEAHLSRAYRIRNEIIHDAAIRPNIESITSNLKYYLTFIINELLEFFLDNPIDANFDNELSIDDFFIVRQLEFNSMQKDGISLDRIFEIKNTVQNFA